MKPIFQYWTLPRHKFLERNRLATRGFRLKAPQCVVPGEKRRQQNDHPAKERSFRPIYLLFILLVEIMGVQLFYTYQMHVQLEGMLMNLKEINHAEKVTWHPSQWFMPMDEPGYESMPWDETASKIPSEDLSI